MCNHGIFMSSFKADIQQMPKIAVYQTIETERVCVADSKGKKD